MGAGPLLELENLSTHYVSARGTRVVRAVEGVSLRINARETLGIVGESGSGKSTLALTILRLLPPAAQIASGKMMFEGEDLLQKSDAEMRRVRGKRIAMILQDPMASLNPLFTIGDQVAEPIRVHEGASRATAWSRAHDLLKAVLGQDPITGEVVPRTAETLIGGFMKLVGQEEVWENIKRANAIGRAWAWFQGALSGLVGFVRQIPRMFLSALQTLEIADLVLLPRAFARVAAVFGGFIGQFLSWAGQQVMSLLQIIFEVVAPGVMPYIRRAAGAFRTIVQNPIGFIGNLVRAGIQGFRQFAGNFLSHLRTSLIQWLTGTLSGANIYIPQAFTLREIIKFVLSVLGLTWQNIRAKLVRVIGETAVAALETGFDIVVTLVTQGPAAAWEKIRESLANLREMVMEQVMTFVRDRIVQAAITRLVTSLNPAGAFIQAIIAIYNTVMFLVERLRQIAQVVAAFIDSIAAIAAGQIGAAANRVEQTMAGLLTLVISFLARLVGLGRVSDAVIAIVDRIRAPIDRALDRVVEWIVNMARRVGRLVAGRAGGPGGAGPRGDIDRPVTLARERHTVRVHAQNGRLQVLMASNGFMAVEQEIAHVRRHFVETYLPAMDRGQEAEVLGRHMDSIVAEKTQWVTRYNAASSDAQKEVVLQAGLNVFVQRFQVVNQALETFIGPWATVRVGDSISYVEGGVPEYALVLEVMVRMGAAFGLNARPIDENPRGRKIPKKLRVSAQSADVVLGPMSRWMPYSRYGPPPGWQKFSGSVPMMPGSNDNPFLIDWPKPAWSAYPKLYFGSPRPQTTQATLRGLMGIDPTVSEFPPSGGTLGGQTIGIQPPYQLAKDSKVGPLSTLTTPGGGRLLTILRPYGFDTAADAMQVDHVQDIGFGGKDTLENLWPLAQTINSAAGGAMSNARATVPGTSATVAVRDLKRLTGTDFWFKLRSVR